MKPFVLRREYTVAALLWCVTIAVYAQVAGHGFVHWDDYHYVAKNEHVLKGLTWESVRWAFTPAHANWHPVTWLSHMMDVELFGARPGPHHLVNAALHATNAVLLLLLLSRMTGALWRSAFVAALFALHPLHVESVAWLAERKDVLSTFFALLTMGAYVGYRRRPAGGRYLLVALLYALALMSKGMVVTLPFVLLLLDYWPLRVLTFHWKEAAVPPGRLFIEKVPLLLMAGAVSLITYLSQLRGGTLDMLSVVVPFSRRIANSLVSYAVYLEKMVLPSGLSPFYPYPVEGLPAPAVVVSGVVLAMISGLCLWQARTRPYLIVGWLWYLGTLLPVIGLVQMGEQARADRYTYMPLVGCFIMAAWGAGEFVEKRRLSKEVVWTAAVVALSAMVLATWVQVGHWRNGVSLFSRAIAVDADNVWGYYNAALALAEEGKDGEAVRYYHESIRLRPDHPDVYKAHMSLAQSLERLGKPEDALAEYREVLKRRPLEAQALNNIGIILAQQGGLGDAIVHYRAALSILPDDPQLRLNLGMAMSLAGRTDEAIAQFEEVVRRRPDDAQARLILERALSERAGKK